MTIHSRNRIFLIGSIISIIFIVAIGLACLFNVLTDHSIRINNNLRIFSISDTIFLFKYNLPSLIVAICILGVFVPITGFFILANFEKTQSPEIIYFAGFLIGCITEILRLVIIVFNLGEGYSLFLFFSTRIVFFGRMITSLCLLFLGIFSASQKTQDADRNLIILLAIAITFSIYIPVNALIFTSTGIPIYGYSKLLLIIAALFAILTFSTLYINGKEHTSQEFKKSAFYYIALHAGYAILLMSDSIAYTVIGGILFIGGTWLCLANIHRYYLWK